MDYKPSSSPTSPQSLSAKVMKLPVTTVDAVTMPNDPAVPVLPIKESLSEFIVQTTKHTDTLSKEQIFALLDDLIEKRCKYDFVFGAVLSRISEKCKVDKAWLEGYPTFTALVKGRFNYVYRTAKYLINNYRYLLENHISAETMKGVGWSKLAVLVESKALTKGNASKLAKMAKKLSNKELKAKVKGKADKPKVIIDPVTKTQMVKKTAKGVGFLAGEELPYYVAAPDYTVKPYTEEMPLEALQKEWDDRLDALTKELKAAFPAGDDAPMAWLKAFERRWPDVVLKVEFPA